MISCKSAVVVTTNVWNPCEEAAMADKRNGGNGFVSEEWKVREWGLGFAVRGFAETRCLHESEKAWGWGFREKSEGRECFVRRVCREEGRVMVLRVSWVKSEGFEDFWRVWGFVSENSFQFRFPKSQRWGF